MEFTQKILVCLFLLTIVLRIWELKIGKRNKLLREKVHSNLQQKEPYYFLFFVLHTSFLLFTPLEVFIFQRPFFWILGVLSVLIYFFCLVLRFHILKELGTSWNTEILSHPSTDTIVTTGIYSKIRHPNYLVVILEFFSLSLFHSAWISLVIFSSLNLILLLKHRIPFEEEILFQNPKYKAHFENKNRFFPF